MESKIKIKLRKGNRRLYFKEKRFPKHLRHNAVTSIPEPIAPIHSQNTNTNKYIDRKYLREQSYCACANFSLKYTTLFYF